MEQENTDVKTIELESDTRIRTNPDFILREIGGESILVPVGDVGPFENSMLTLNETSAFLWKLFMEGCTTAEALEKALQEYTSEEEDKKDIIGGVHAYVVQSLNLGLLIPETEED